MYNPDRGFPGVVPELRYRDVAAAGRWLVEVLGFEQLLTHSFDGVTLQHVDLSTRHGIVMLGSAEADTASEPTTSVQLIVYVDDVDATARRARAADADVLTDPTTKPWGLRQFLVRDPEGYLWEPTQHVSDVPAAAWGAEITGDEQLLG